MVDDVSVRSFLSSRPSSAPRFLCDRRCCLAFYKALQPVSGAEWKCYDWQWARRRVSGRWKIYCGWPTSEQLFLRTVNKGHHVGPLFRIAELVEDDEFGDQRDVPRAAYSYRVTDENGDARERNNVALRLEYGTDRISQNGTRAVQN